MEVGFTRRWWARRADYLIVRHIIRALNGAFIGRVAPGVGGCGVGALGHSLR